MFQVALLALVPVLPAQAPSQVRIETVRVPYCAVAKASSDGTWVVGSHVRKDFLWLFPYRWSSATGFESLFDIAPVYEGLAISDDGQRVLTRYMFDTYHDLATAAVWTPGGVLVFPGQGHLSATSLSTGSNISRDGRFVSGWGYYDSTYISLPWVWDTQGEVVLLPSDPGDSSFAMDVSDDGRVVVGIVHHAQILGHAALWVDGERELLQEGTAAYGTNADGTFVTGAVGSKPFLWSREAGLSELESIPPTLPPDFTVAYGTQVSDDGSTVLATQVFTPLSMELRRFLWRSGAGAVDVRTLLPALGSQDLGNFAWFTLVTLGADGRTLVGSAVDSTHPEETWIWRAVLPPSAEIYCTSQTSSAGCTPEIGSSGTPSARSAAGFTITAGGVPEGARAVLSWSTTGAAALPYAGGVLCLAEPYSRVVLGPATGDGPCAGSLALDFNAVVAQSGDPALVGGAPVWAQFWIRDTGAPPPQLLLSDALTFTLWP